MKYNIKTVFKVIAVLITDIISDIKYKPKHAMVPGSLMDDVDWKSVHNPEEGQWVSVTEHTKTIDVVFHEESDMRQTTPSVVKYEYTIVKDQLKPETLRRIRELIKQ